jgi:hypothetical protein
MPKYLVYLKPFFILLNILPKVVYGVGKENHNINTDEIKMDMSIVEALRKI